jgi:hypothetical protein
MEQMRMCLLIGHDHPKMEDPQKLQTYKNGDGYRIGFPGAMLVTKIPFTFDGSQGGRCRNPSNLKSRRKEDDPTFRSSNLLGQTFTGRSLKHDIGHQLSKLSAKVASDFPSEAITGLFNSVSDKALHLNEALLMATLRTPLFAANAFGSKRHNHLQSWFFSPRYERSKKFPSELNNGKDGSPAYLLVRGAMFDAFFLQVAPNHAEASATFKALLKHMIRKNLWTREMSNMNKRFNSCMDNGGDQAGIMTEYIDCYGDKHPLVIEAVNMGMAISGGAEGSEDSSDDSSLEMEEEMEMVSFQGTAGTSNSAALMKAAQSQMAGVMPTGVRKVG